MTFDDEIQKIVDKKIDEFINEGTHQTEGECIIFAGLFGAIDSLAMSILKVCPPDQKDEKTRKFENMIELMSERMLQNIKEGRALDRSIIYS